MRRLRRPLSDLTLRLYQSDERANVAALAVANPKETFVILGAGDEKPRRLLAETTMDADGNFPVERGEGYAGEVVVPAFGSCAAGGVTPTPTVSASLRSGPPTKATSMNGKKFGRAETVGAEVDGLAPYLAYTMGAPSRRETLDSPGPK